MKRDTAIIILTLLLVLALALSLYASFRPKQCYNYACFQDYMAVCARAVYINEEPEASWQYNILKRTRESCEILVTLLQAKEGELKLRTFEGHSMICTYPQGVVAYPDKDLSLCHGRLKEDIQGILIEKLYNYVVQNLAELKEEFTQFGLNQSLKI